MRRLWRAAQPDGAVLSEVRRVEELVHAAVCSRVHQVVHNCMIADVQMGIGIGLVPGYYPLLDDLRRRGLLYYAQTDLSPIRSAIYLPAEGEDGLSKAARALLDRIKTHAKSLQTKSGWDLASKAKLFPSNPNQCVS